MYGGMIPSGIVQAFGEDSMTPETRKYERSPRVADAFMESLVGSGEMAGLILVHDWSRTPLGPIDTWPQSLRAALSIMLASGYPM